jgi:hypothetical protein
MLCMMGQECTGTLGWGYLEARGKFVPPYVGNYFGSGFAGLGE